MTSIYFVRHAEPVHSWEVDRTRPLTAEGLEDSKKVTHVLEDVKLDYAISSPYRRSVDTIKDCIDTRGLNLHTDERLRERESGPDGRTHEMIRKRWENMEYHEEGGESLRMLQQRNMEALLELLREHEGKNIILGTHGSALSTILNYYDPSFDGESFFRILDIMPYIIRLDFEGDQLVGKEELLMIEKEFRG